MRFDPTRLAALGAIFLLFVVGCGGSPESEQAAPTTASTVFDDGSKVRSITIGHDAVQPDRVERLLAYDGPTRIREGVTNLLTEAGHMDPAGSLDVAISIDDFRLRSSAAAFWLGAMVGSDLVFVTVRVEQNGTEIKSFSTSTSTILGGALYASAGRRMGRLAKTISARVVAGL